MKSKPNNIDEYIAACAPDVQTILQKVRATIWQAAPEAEETISYGMPCFAQNGNLVYFAAWKNHLGFYPSGSGIAHFSPALSAYKGAKGSVQFPYALAIPYELIAQITQFRVQENLAKKTKRKSP